MIFCLTRVTKLEQKHTDFFIQSTSALPSSTVSPFKISCSKPAARAMPDSSPLNLPNQTTNTTSQHSFLNSTVLTLTQSCGDKKDEYKKLIEGLTIGLDDPTPQHPPSHNKSIKDRLNQDKVSKKSRVSLPDDIHITSVQ